jgi:Mpv17 / PMP22 family
MGIFVSNKGLKMFTIGVIIMTTGVSAFIHSGRHIRFLHSTSLGTYYKNTDNSQTLTETFPAAKPRFVLVIPFQSLLQAYSYASSHYFLLTQSATMSVFSGVGDIIAQSLERRKTVSGHDGLQYHDWTRTKRFLMKGLGCGLIWTAWYQIAEIWSHAITNILQSVIVGTHTTWSPILLLRIQTVLSTITSILLEQFIASPIIFAFWDIPLLSYLHGVPIARLPGEVRRKLIPLLIANAKLWTLVNILIYNVPLHYRVAALSLADLAWQTILSTQLGSSSNFDSSLADGTHTDKTGDLDDDEVVRLPL